MQCKEITVNNEKFLAILLPDSVFFKEQHLKFMELFKESVLEVNKIMSSSPAFGDPTKGFSKEVLDDTKNNAILLPDTLMQTLNKNPEADVNNDLVYLVKPSGVYIITYLEASGVNFPRIMNLFTKTELDPQQYILAYEQR